MKLIITRINNRNICAWYDKNRLIQISLESADSKGGKICDIYTARVKNIVNNINAAFVETCDGQLCFLQLKPGENPIYLYDNHIEKQKLKMEDEILVQILREGLKTKQPAVTCEISIPGKYLILTTKKYINVSNKIKDVMRRKELKEWLMDSDDEFLKNSVSCGFIVRTNSCDATKEQILREKKYLESTYEKIINQSRHNNIFSCVYKAPSDYLCAVRDCYDYEIEQIITDIPDIYDTIKDYLTGLYPEVLERLHLYTDKSYSLSALYGVESGLEKAMARKVWLNSGAYLVIDITEACTVIDVNSGKAIHGKKTSEETFFKINKEAAEEILLQLRLRNISGIILIDFIDMKSEEHNAELLSILRVQSAKDPLKTVVVDITKLGLVEITRKKTKKSIYEYFSK